MGLKEMFKGMDTDSSGTITLEELRQGLAKQGTRLSEYEVQQLMEAVSPSCTCKRFSFSQMPSNRVGRGLTTNFVFFCSVYLQADADGNGTIDYGEFIAATMHINRLDREEHLYSAFQHFDKDNSG